MGVPTKVKTYQYNVNQHLVTSGNLFSDIKALFLAWKNGLVGFALNPWIVSRSSNATTASAADNWTTAADLTFGETGDPRSWIVLRNPVTTIEVLIDMFTDDGTDPHTTIPVYVSANAGFTGGTTTARPTAVDEHLEGLDLIGGWPLIDATGAADLYLHLVHSTDGTVTFAACTKAGVLIGFQTYFAPLNPIAGWSNPAAWAVKKLGDPATLDALNVNPGASGRIAGHNLDFYFTTESFGATKIPEVTGPDQQTGNYPITPIGLYSDTALVKGRKGRVPDLYWGLAVVNTGDTYPADGSKTWVQFGSLVVPWNGSDPLV